MNSSILMGLFAAPIEKLVSQRKIQKLFKVQLISDLLKHGFKKTPFRISLKVLPPHFFLNLTTLSRQAKQPTAFYEVSTKQLPHHKRPSDQTEPKHIFQNSVPAAAHFSTRPGDFPPAWTCDTSVLISSTSRATDEL